MSLVPLPKDGWKHYGVKMRPRAQQLYSVLVDFIENDVIPAEKIYEDQMGPPGKRFEVIPPIIEELKKKARALGLWNLFLTEEYKEGAGLTNTEYSVMCELMGMTKLAPEATNTAAPDTGNMEVLAKFGTPAQKQQWLVPLMAGEIRSCFAMTEPTTASSDATNVSTSIVRDGDSYVINGRKWWSSGAPDPRCKLFVLVGKTDPGNADRHRQQTVVLVPRDTPGITIVRNLQVFGWDDAPHGHSEVLFENVRVPASNLVLGEGRGFEVLQGRLGPGRIHHCMRAVGVAERALQLMVLEATNSKKMPFGKLKGEHGKALFDIAESRIEIEAARMLVLKAAARIDEVGARKSLKEIALAKVFVPNVVGKILDRAIQIHGGAGVCQDHPVAFLYAHNRTLRLADGPDEVHTLQLGRNELKRSIGLREREERLIKRTEDVKRAKALL